MKGSFYKDISFFQIEKYLNGQCKGREFEKIEFLEHSNASFREKLEHYKSQESHLKYSMLEYRLKKRSLWAKFRSGASKILGSIVGVFWNRTKIKKNRK
jgi:cell shape-determining protein MreC